MFSISKNQYILIQFYMKWTPFDFKHFCILCGIKSIKLKHESCLISLQVVDELPLLNTWIWQSFSYPSMSHNISAVLRSELFSDHSNTFSVFLGRFLTYTKALDLARTCSVTFSHRLRQFLLQNITI